MLDTLQRADDLLQLGAQRRQAGGAAQTVGSRAGIGAAEGAVVGHERTAQRRQGALRRLAGGVRAEEEADPAVDLAVGAGGLAGMEALERLRIDGQPLDRLAGIGVDLGRGPLQVGPGPGETVAEALGVLDRVDLVAEVLELSAQAALALAQRRDALGLAADGRGGVVARQVLGRGAGERAPWLLWTVTA